MTVPMKHSSRDSDVCSMNVMSFLFGELFRQKHKLVVSENVMFCNIGIHEDSSLNNNQNRASSCEMF